MEELTALIVSIAMVACGLSIADGSWSSFAREHEPRLSSDGGSGNMTRTRHDAHTHGSARAHCKVPAARHRVSHDQAAAARVSCSASSACRA